ncbi:MAG: hypothetical protein HPY45_03790 [Anaerolineae bacterium]|nr:hypothetical protein [Anaerolineae bacterium]
MCSEALAVIAIIFSVLGCLLILVGYLLSSNQNAANLKDLCLLFGLIFLIAGIPDLLWRFQQTRKNASIYINGDFTIGQIIEVQENLSVRILRQPQWLIHYRFAIMGTEYRGTCAMSNPPSPQYCKNAKVYVIYKTDNPRQNLLYHKKQSLDGRMI